VLGQCASNNLLYGQTVAGEQATIESRYVVDMPTAGVLSRGRWAVEVYALGNSGVMANISFAPLTNVNVGISYAGAGFLGNSPIIIQGIPGFNVSWRPVDETLTVPAFLLGLQTQGRGLPLGNGRFETHSPGIYIAASKNFSLLGSLALHGGINYSFEPAPADRRPNLWFGLEKTLGTVVSLTAEFNTTFDNPYTMRRIGLLNAGLRVATGMGFTFELQLRDLLLNLNSSSAVYRIIRMEYIGRF
jgi:hypothetical protein